MAGLEVDIHVRSCRSLSWKFSGGQAQTELAPVAALAWIHVAVVLHFMASVLGLGLYQTLCKSTGKQEVPGRRMAFL